MKARSRSVRRPLCLLSLLFLSGLPLGHAADLPPSKAPTPDRPGVLLPPVGKVQWDWQIGAASEQTLTVPEGVELLGVDLYGISAEKVQELKTKGVYLVCYFNAGSYQPGYPDSEQYPDYLKLQEDPNWPGEFYVDVTNVFKRNSALARILEARLNLCKEKGFDAVEPDNLQNDEIVRGRRISVQQQLDFNGWIADAAHRRELAVFQKNAASKVLLKDRSGQRMVEKFDGIVNEECQAFQECALVAEYSRRGKLALNAEYRGAPNCRQSDRLQINTIQKDRSHRGGAEPGYFRAACP